MKVLNIDYAKKFGDQNLKVKLKKGKKGVSLYARKPIKKGQVIAYYKFKVYKDATYEGVHEGSYSITVYTKGDNTSKTLIGDIYEGSLEPPKYGIPFWAYFSNEPSHKEKPNAYLDINLDQNYKDRKQVKAGDTMVYKIRALRNIKPDEEITWCYGEAYVRGYKTSCD